ncbi:MAG: homoserine kinase [Candidatus Obscuribacterales bacterium]|nr:homoserine kinase [Candidatus Obscuribacterales bacterium]
MMDTELSASFADDLLIDRDKIARSITLTIPASTCNLGPGLDTLGLALSLYTRITVWLLKKNYSDVPRVVLRGAMADISDASDQGDLIYTMLMKLWKSTPRDASRLRVLVHSNIPLGSGLGGTGTVVLGGLWASYVLRDFIPTRPKILAEATAVEQHPESLAPSLMGNLVICGTADAGNDVLTEQIEWPEQWHTIVITPSYRLTTPKARAVLPKQVKLDDAIFNIQRTSLLLAAVQNQNESTMKQALDDRLHERYRSKQVPELAEIRAVLHKEPIIGCVLSGAGSSILVIVNHKKKEVVLSNLKQWIAREQKTLTVLDLTVDRSGLREIACE